MGNEEPSIDQMCLIGKTIMGVYFLTYRENNFLEMENNLDFEPILSTYIAFCKAGYVDFENTGVAGLSTEQTQLFTEVTWLLRDCKDLEKRLQEKLPEYDGVHPNNLEIPDDDVPF